MLQALPVSLMIPHLLTKERHKRKASTSIKKWNERNTTLLIDLLEEGPSLWDMFDSEYTKREVRELAYKEIAEKLGENWTLSEIKSKINNLRAQLGREIKKTKKTKIGQLDNTSPLGLIGIGCSFSCHS